jgi:hypothetical protein
MVCREHILLEEAYLKIGITAIGCYCQNKLVWFVAYPDDIMSNNISLDEIADVSGISLNEVREEISLCQIPVILKDDNKVYVTDYNAKLLIQSVFSSKAEEVVGKLCNANEQPEKQEKIIASNLAFQPSTVERSWDLKALEDEFPKEVKRNDTEKAIAFYADKMNVDYWELVKAIILQETGAKIFVDALAQKLKHPRSKDASAKIKEIKEFAIKAWEEKASKS